MFTQTMSVAEGAEFFVRLGATPSTGYVWTPKIHSNGIVLSSSEFEAHATGNAPGHPGVQVFRIRATRSGNFEIVFDLKREWEPNPIQSCAVKITVI